jgi:ATP-dependent Lon protease
VEGDEFMSGAAPESEDDRYEAPALFAEDAILFPEMEVTITVQDSKNVAAATQAFKERKLVVLVPAPGPDGAAGSIGTLVLLRKMVPARGGGAEALSKGLWRVRVERVLEESPYARVRFTKAGESEEVHSKSSMMEAVFGQIDEFVRMMPGIPSEIVAFLKKADAPGKLADVCAYSPFFTYGERLDLLRTLDAEERLGKVYELFKRQLGDLKQLANRKTILECTTCMDLADRAFELGPDSSGDLPREFLDHVIREHAGELLGLLAERYGPEFMRRRALK